MICSIVMLVFRGVNVGKNMPFPTHRIHVLYISPIIYHININHSTDQANIQNNSSHGISGAWAIFGNPPKKMAFNSSTPKKNQPISTSRYFQVAGVKITTSKVVFHGGIIATSVFVRDGWQWVTSTVKWKK